LINNAGIGIDSPFEFVPLETVKSIMDVNFFGAVGMTQEMLPMIRQSEGRIINIGSLAGELTIPFMGPYCASKFAMGVFTDALRRELRPWNIYVGIIEPSYVKTPMLDRSKDSTVEIFNRLPKEAHDLYGDYFSEETMKKRYKEGIDNADWKSSEVGQLILDSFLDPRPNIRYMIGYGSSGLSILKHFSDSLIDFVLEKARWSKDTSKK